MLSHKLKKLQEKVRARKRSLEYRHLASCPHVKQGFTNSAPEATYEAYANPGFLQKLKGL